MEIVVLDFESFYDSKNNYTLKKMNNAEYILDPRFEAIGCTFQHGFNGEPYWVDGPDLQAHFNKLTRRVMAVSHNWQFDGSIAAWRYGWLPELSCCTLSIARATLGHILGMLPSLKRTAEYLGLPPKGDVVHRVDGMCRAAIIAAGLYGDYVAYCKQDTAICAMVLHELVVKRKLFPISELAVLDAVLRCTTEPRFRLNVNLLHEHLAEVQAAKETALARIGVDRKVLMSNDQFADLIRQHGVEPPMKISPATGKQTYAFAKTDVDFLELQEHESETVQALVNARLGVKSTLEETRTQRFINISRLQWPGYSADEYQMDQSAAVGLMPMPLRYSAAGPHRLGGDWDLNVQNLSRSNPIKPGSGKLRHSLEAPPGYQVMTVDASQIEARLVVYFSGQEDVVEQFRQNKDVYAILASEIYRRPINKKDDPNERFVGKQARLGLGYQLWWPKFKNRVKTDSINQLGYPIELTEDEAINVVTTFRCLNDKVVQSWHLLNAAGVEALRGGQPFTWGACTFTQGVITGPSGLQMHYPDFAPIGYTKDNGKKGKDFVITPIGTDAQLWRVNFKDENDGLQERKVRSSDLRWSYATPRKGRVGIYGGKLMENVCQHLARVHTLEAAVRITNRSVKELGTAYRLCQQAHDENVFMVNDIHVSAMRLIMQEEMCRQDWWCPGFPFACEVGVGPNYGAAK